MKEYILIVDDETAIREQISEYLAAFGLQSDTAANAEEALVMLKNKQYDVVIT